jgi:hypothetical protein
MEQDLDAAPDSPADGGTATATVDNSGSTGENNSFSELQDRMAGDDSPWYSPSSGAVVTKDGVVLVNPKTGEPYRSEDEYFAHQKEIDAKKNTAKPKTLPVKPQPQKPMSKSFDFYVRGEESELSDEKLRELAKNGSDYQYRNDLVPKVAVAKQQSQQQSNTEQKIDPVEQVEKDHQVLIGLVVNPLREIREALIAQGANPQAVDEIFGDRLQKSVDLVEGEYKKAYRKAMQDSVSGPVNERLSLADQKEQQSIAEKNVTTLSQKYYPNGGIDQFYSLINGYKDEKDQFVRGPAAQVVDLLVSIASEGKTFENEKERTKQYSDIFRKITADLPKAKALFDIAHNYYLGKQLNAAKNMLFSKGKEAALKDQQRIQKTIKTRPASYSAPQNVDNEAGVPQLLRTITGAMAR